MMRNCRDVARLLSYAEETSLSWRERWAVRVHQLFCVYCRRYGRQIVLLRRVLARRRGLRRDISSLDAPARERIQAALSKNNNVK
ncbi:MAG: anti-sigma factor family protein [Acidiferrobacteraceae bacterium]